MRIQTGKVDPKQHKAFQPYEYSYVQIYGLTYGEISQIDAWCDDAFGKPRVGNRWCFMGTNSYCFLKEEDMSYFILRWT